MKRFLSLAAVKTKTMKTNYSNLGGYAGNTDGVSFSNKIPKTIEIVDQTKSSRFKQNAHSIGQLTAKFVGFLAFCFLMFQNVASGQTLVDPTGDGGFNNGTTFASNGWTVANFATSTNQWVVGSGVVTAPFAGRSAYISNNGGTSNVYDVASSNSCYFYRDIAIPAGATYIPLTYTFVSNGESTWDMIQVYIAPTTVTPVGSLHAGSGTAGPIPASLTGATQLAFHVLIATPQTANLVIPPSFAGQTVRLIFMWKSDTSGGATPSGSIDNISVVASTTPPTSTSTALGGLWSSPATWASGAVPNPGADVTIASGAIVTVDQAIIVTNLTINGRLQWNATSNAAAVYNDLVISSTGSFLPHTPALVGQTINISRNFTNNGYANLACASTALNFNGSGATVSGTGSFLTDGTADGLVRTLSFQNTGANVISTTQNLKLSNGLTHTAGSLNTNNKLKIDNTAQVYGQTINQQVSSLVVTGMGTAYSAAPVVFGVAVTQWTNITGVLNTLYVSGSNVYRCTAAANIGPSAPVHTSGIAQNLLWIGTIGNLGTPFLGAQAHVLGTQYFYGNNLYTCIVAGTPVNTAPPTHTSGIAVSGTATFLYVGTVAKATVNFDATTQTVRSLNLTQTGAGYVSAPGIVFSVGVAGGTVTTAAAATAVYIQQIAGPANSLTQKSGGAATISGTIAINSDQGASTLSGGLVQSSSGVGAISTTAGGNNYTVAPTVGFAGPTALNLVTNSGSGYTSAPTVTVTGGTLVSATALATANFTITVNQGRVVSVYLNVGTTACYSVPPTLTITGGGGTGATIAFPTNCWPAATAVIGANRQILSFTITNAGFGYVAAPTLSFGATSGTATGGTFTTAATAPTARIALYNLTSNFFSPATAAVVQGEDAAIPTSRKLNILSLAGNGMGMTVTDNLILFGSTTPILLNPSGNAPGNVLNLGTKDLIFTWNGYAGTTPTFGATNTYITNGSMTLTGRGGGTTGGTFNFPFSGTFTCFTGTGAGFIDGADILTVKVTEMGAPSNATNGTGSAIGARAFKVNTATVSGTNTAAAGTAGTNRTITLNYNSQDALATTLTQDLVFVSEATALTGAWNLKSTALGGGTAIAATGTKVTATTAPGPVSFANNTFYAWSTPLPTCPTLTAPANAATGVSQVVNLTWTAGTYTSTYDVYISVVQADVDNQVAGARVSLSQTGLSFVTATLNPLTTYFWRVVPKNSVGTSTNTCTTFSFTTQAAVPSITCGSLATFGNVCINGTSTSNSFSVAGLNLTGDLSVGALAGYTYSTTVGGTYTSTLALPQSGGSVSATVYVRFTPTSASSFNGNIVVTGTADGISQNVAATASGVVLYTASSTATPTPLCSGSSSSLSLLVSKSGNVNLGAGAGTSSLLGVTMFPGAWGGAKTQYIIRASELTALGLTAGNITALAFEATTSGQAYPGFALSIGATSNTVMTNSFISTGLTQVFSSASYTPTIGVNTLTFSSGFNWDGVSNIVVSFCWSTGLTTSTGSTVKTDVVSFVSSYGWQVDSQTSGTVCGTVGTPTGGSASTPGSTRPRFIFTGNNAPAATSFSWSDGSSTVGTSNPLSVLPSSTTSYTGSALVAGCPVAASLIVLTVTPPLNAPTFTNNNAQCGSGIPSVTFAGANSQPSPNLNWYTASSGGTNANPSAYSGAVTTTYYNNSFATGLTANGVTGLVNGNASYTGTTVQITPNAASQVGGFTIPGTGIDVDAHEFSFKLLTTTGGADGMSFNFGDDVPATSGTAEAGAGTKLSVTFNTYGTPGITVKYNGASLGFFNTDLTWRGTNAQMLISINNAGQITVSVNGTPVLSNIQLPAAYLSANKSAWTFNYLARTGAVTSFHTIDDVIIKYAAFVPATTFPTAISATTTWYVSENVGACESPRTPVTVTVNTPDPLTAAATVTNIACLGSSTALSVTKTGTSNTYSPLTWSLTSYTGSGLSGATTTSLSTPLIITPTAAGTYNFLITGIDGACTATSNISVIVSNPLTGLTAVAVASNSTICSGNSTSLSVTIPDAVKTLGAGATTSVTVAQSFFPGAWGGAKTQYIIRASELTALGMTAGNISGVAFEPTTSGQTYTGFQLWVNTTANASMTTTFLPNGTQVYLATGTNNGYLPVANTVNTLAFGTGAGSSSSFNWDGTSNLVLTFSWSSVPTASTSTGTTMKVDAPGFTCSAYEQSDVITPAAQLAMAVGDGVGTSRPKFIFTVNTAQAPFTYSWSNGASVVGTTNPLSVSPTSTTNYTCTPTVAGCPLISNAVTVTVTPPLSVPIASNSTQCGPAIPTAYMSTGNAQSSPVYNWYSASTGGTALNTMTTYYNNDFSTSLTANGVTGIIYADANLNTTTGFVRLTSNTASMNGALSIPAIGINANAYQFGFDLTTPTGGADGMSFNFGDDVDPVSVTPTAEVGSGTKLSVTFDIYDAAGTPATGQGIRVKYAGVELAYNSTNLAWIGTAFAPILIDINSAGQISVTAGGVLVISNLQLPAGFLAANKSSWAFAYKARTGGVFGVHRIDNVLIKYLPTPNSTYPNSVSSTTTFYVSESVGTCESPRTPITVNVLSNTPPAAPTVTSTPTINVGGTSSYTATGVVGGTISWYSSALGGAVLGTGTTFTSPTQCTPNTNITYFASDDDGTCVSSTRGSSITAVRPLITTDPTNALICTTGGNVVLSANVTGGSSIAWSPGTNLTSTTALVTTASPTTTTQYTFNANVAGCSTQSGTVNVGVIAGAAFTPTATPASLCEGGTSVLASNLASAGFTVSTITNAPSTAPGTAVTLANGTATPVVALTSGSNDDGGWGAIPLGFTYNFFGANYTSVNASTNGLIQFGAYNANGGAVAPYGLADFTYANAFPTTLEPMNIVAGGACDLTITNGTVRYWTEGLAPTRAFVISYNVNGLGSGNNTFQIKLFETTGIVEVHVTSNTAQTASNKAIGVNNFDGTIGNTAYNNIANLTNTAYRFVPGAAYTFQWSVGGSNASGASTSTSYTTPQLNSPGSIVYSVAATNPLTQCASIQPVTITVNPKPTAPISGGNVTACSNITPQTLSVTAPVGCTIDWYAGSTGGTVLASGTGTATFSVTTAGTYYAEARNTTTGCTSPTRTAVVYTQTVAPAAPTVTTPIAFCENAIATALSATAAGTNTLNWYTVPTGGTPSSTAPTPLTTTATTLNYYVTQVDAVNSCESDRALIAVNINATPLAPTTSAAGPYCENAVATPLSATATGANTLNWYTVATGGTGSGTAITPATTPAATTLYYVSQTAAYTLPTITCESTRASISVLVNPNITASVDNSATTTSLCTGGNIDFTATPTNGGATPSYQWQVNGVNVGTNSPTYTLTPSLFSDNAGNAAYSSGWSNSSNGGSGFGAWNMTIGANTGTFIGNPLNDGNGTAGIGTDAFGMYATGSAYLNALRPINGGMQVGDTLSFYWIFNWDANGGNKGFDFKNGGTTVFNINNGGSATITSTAGTVNTTYGTTPMLVKLVRISASQYAFSMTSRSSGGTYTNTITNSTSIDGINFYIGNQNDGSGNRNMYVNNLIMKKYYEVVVNMTPSAQTCLTSSSVTPSNTIVLGYSPSTPTVAIVAGSTTTICPGTSLSFSVSSSANLGATPTYQWQVNGVDVSGATNSTFSSTTLANGNVVSLIVTSSISGGCLTSTTASSNNISVTVQSPTAISTQPTDAAACLGATQIFSAAATGTGTISYQWYKSNTLITGNPTAITNSLTLSGLVAGSAADYYLRATGTCGSANSDTITLTLNPNTAITTQPIALSQCVGTNALFSTAATGFGTLTFQWRKNGSAIIGATNDTLILSNIQSTDAATYSVLVTGGCNSLASSSVALTVNQLVNFVTQPAATPTVCAGSTTNLSASVTGAGTLSYQWQLSGVNVPSATGASLSISNTQAINGGVYTLIATSSLCGADTSTVSTLTVNPVTTISTQPIDVTLCNGSDALFNVVTAGIGTINYQWRYNGTNIPGATNDTLLVNNIINTANAGTYSVVVTGGTCSSGTINSTTVSLNIQSSTNAVSGSQSATCVVKGSDWIHFYTSDGKLLVSIKTAANSDLGAVTATSYVNADAQITTACADPAATSFHTAVLGRNWYINPTNNLPATIRLPITNAEVTALIAKSATTSANPNDNVFSIANINLSKYNGLNENGSWQDNCNTATNTSNATSNLYIPQASNGTISVANGFIETIAGSSFLEFNIPGFSEFWLMNSGNATPLPVQLKSLTASCNEEEVVVKWSTATEQNSQSFKVERSRDLAIWEFVTEIDAAGNSTSSIDYSVNDFDPISGVSYYRLKQVDFNGVERIYGPISVSCSEIENSMVVFPNPTKGNFTVEISSAENITDAQIQITDLTGKVINERAANILEGKSQFTFEGLDLQLGTYIINLQAGNGKINPVRVVVN